MKFKPFTEMKIILTKQKKSIFVMWSLHFIPSIVAYLITLHFWFADKEWTVAHEIGTLAKGFMLIDLFHLYWLINIPLVTVLSLLSIIHVFWFQRIFVSEWKPLVLLGAYSWYAVLFLTWWGDATNQIYVLFLKYFVW